MPRVGRDTAVGGWGAYLGVTCRGEKWVADLSYGSYQTEQIGDPAHDEQTREFRLNVERLMRIEPMRTVNPPMWEES